ncbi:recombinase family protein [Undibacterium sp.]|uniref:recombinase family protein n=1 Tax=Undibacterium sp. TaxID=1914977 RepID=UPI00272F2975|nr:recombinase family protein [Undibacterium sp.]MDP1980569.1 recombinase family protein [Undibacterium sp.]
MSSKYYGYCRFSSVGQSKYSIDRQEDYIKHYAGQNNFHLEDIFSDKGISAKAGANRLEGTAWADLMGVARAGDHILLENLDRFSREDVRSAQRAINDVLDVGIAIHVIKSGLVLHKDSESIDIDIIRSVFENSAAHKENVKRSQRAKAAHKNRLEKLQEGQFVQVHTPYWIEKSSSEGTYKLNEGASVVERMFAMCNEGKGTKQIATALNQGGIKTLRSGKTWTQAGILSVLKNRACIGEYKGREGFLPAVVTKEMFDLAQVYIADRKLNKTGRNTGNFNVMKGVSVCMHCGGNMYFQQRNRASGMWLVCKNKSNGSCVGRGGADIKGDLALRLFREIVIKIEDEDAARPILNDSELRDAQNKLKNWEADMQENYSTALAKMVSTQERIVNKLKQEHDNAMVQQSLGGGSKQERIDLLNNADDASKTKLNTLLRRKGVKIEWGRSREDDTDCGLAKTENLAVSAQGGEITVLPLTQDMLWKAAIDGDFNADWFRQMYKKHKDKMTDIPDDFDKLWR